MIHRKKLKRTLKAVLPDALFAYLARQRQMRKLAATPRGNAIWNRLVTRDLYQPEFGWRRADVLENWAADMQVLLAYYPGGDVPCGTNMGDLQALYMLVRSLQPARVLEVGTHVGMSTMAMALAMRRNGHGLITTVDLLDVNHPISGPWRSYGMRASPRDMLTAAELDQHVHFVAQAAETFLNQDESTYDFIFLDGDHDAHAVYRELIFSADRLSPAGGYLALHDVYPAGEKLFGPSDEVIWGPAFALARLEGENRELKVQPVSPLPWPTKGGTYNSSLAMLFRR